MSYRSPTPPREQILACAALRLWQVRRALLADRVWWHKVNKPVVIDKYLKHRQQRKIIEISEAFIQH